MVGAAIRCRAATACSARASLDIAEHAVENDDYGDHDRLERHAFGPLNAPRDEGHDDGGAEQK